MKKFSFIVLFIMSVAWVFAKLNSRTIKER